MTHGWLQIHSSVKTTSNFKTETMSFVSVLDENVDLESLENSFENLATDFRNGFRETWRWDWILCSGWPSQNNDTQRNANQVRSVRDASRLIFVHPRCLRAWKQLTVLFWYHLSAFRLELFSLITVPLFDYCSSL